MEDLDRKLTAFEFKWNPKAKTRRPSKILETYPGSEFSIITPSG